MYINMNKENDKIAIIVGASGLIGSLLLHILLENDYYQKIVVLVRKDLGIKHPKLEQHCIDFDKIDSYKDVVVGNDLYCCLGTTIKTAGSQQAFRKVDLDYPVMLAQLAKENNVKQFLIVTSMGANTGSLVFYMRTKGECEEAIRSIGIDSVSVFRPASLIGERKEYRLSEAITIPVLKVLSLFFVGGFRKYRPISARQVAKAMFEIAQKDTTGYSVYESDQIQAI